MNERCRCGAELISELSFCVTCGTPRPAHPAMAAAGRHGRPAPAGVAQPWGPPMAPQPPMRPAPPMSPMPTLQAAPVPMAYPAPAAPRSSSAPWIVGAASVVVLAIVGALLVVTMRPAVVYGATPARPATTVVTPTTVTVAPSPSSSSYDTASSSSYDTSGYGTSGSGSTSSTSTEALNDQVSADHSAVEAVTDQWVPQLSSKRVGTVADGVTYDADTILSHYRGLAASHPGAKLVWSGDWPVFKESDYWVVVVAQPFSTADAANSWCSAQGLGPDDCFAKKLSHSGGPQGSTKTRS